MTASNESFQNEPLYPGSTSGGTVIRTLVVDEDPIFRGGVNAWLQPYADFEVIENFSYGAIALERLHLYREQDTTSPFLVILGGPISFPSLSQANNYSNLMAWCHKIKATDPTVRVVIVGADHGEAIDAAYHANADGYLCKTWRADALLHHLRQAAFGQFQWSEASRGMEDGPIAIAQPPARPTLDNPFPDAKAGMPLSGSPLGGQTTAPFVTKRPMQRGPLAQVRFRLRLSGLEQIDTQLNHLLPYLNRTTLDARHYVSVVDRWVIAGRCRELRAAHWVVSRVLATPSLNVLTVDASYRPPPKSPPSGVSPLTPTREGDRSDRIAPGIHPSMIAPPASPHRDKGGQKNETLLARWQRQLGAIARQPIYQATSDNVPTLTHLGNANSRRVENAGQMSIAPPSSAVSNPYQSIPITPISVRATLFDSLRDRLQSPLMNQTEHPLEMDILREEKKRELLVLVLHKILVLLDDLRYSEVQPQQLQERRSQLFYDLWQSILTDYFGKYYVVQVDGVEREVVAILSQDARVVQEAIFDRIPFAVDLLTHFLFQAPLEIDSVPYSLGTPEAIERAELLLDNLVIQMGNSVVYPLLNYLADVELIKQNFYHRQLMSSREIARFRNTLSWHYRRKQVIGEPTAIFESTHVLFTLNGMGIKQINIYASRRTELEQLSGFPLIVTLLLEFRDAVSPRVRGAIAAVGTGVIYLLTEVIGRAIGLVGRGIIKGIGSAWEDFR